MATYQTQRPSFGAQHNQANNQDFRRATAFLNISMPGPDGKLKQIGKVGIALYDDRVTDNSLIQFLSSSKNVEDDLARLQAHMVLSFNMADGSNANSGFDFKALLDSVEEQKEIRNLEKSMG